MAIILVTGPTGSGKTTTLYSTLKQVAKPEVNVCTVEDPIELVEPAFNQMQVHAGIDLTFASGVRTLLRQDPDIIMIGEIRDAETADMAVQAALTGHLVFSTLHTNDAPSSVSRLLDLGVQPFLIQSTLLGIIAQRLVRTLCPQCKRAAEIPDADWEMLVSPWKAQKPRKVYEAVGCLECRNTGYKGRIGIYEMMHFTHKLKPLVTERLDLDALRDAALKEGMKPLRLRGAQKVAEGVTTLGRGDARGAAPCRARQCMKRLGVRVALVRDLLCGDVRRLRGDRVPSAHARLAAEPHHPAGHGRSHDLCRGSCCRTQPRALGYLPGSAAGRRGRYL